MVDRTLIGFVALFLKLVTDWYWFVNYKLNFELVHLLQQLSNFSRCIEQNIGSKWRLVPKYRYFKDNLRILWYVISALMLVIIPNRGYFVCFMQHYTLSGTLMNDLSDNFDMKNY